MAYNSKETPRQYFQQRYGFSAKKVEITGRKRIDLPDVFKSTAPKTAQGFYDGITMHNV